MPTVRFDHAYVSVLDMDRAVRFYENLLGMNACHREGDTWADFDEGHGCYFGLINPSVLEEERRAGNNAIVVFRSDDVDAAFERVKSMGVEILFPPMNLDFTEYPYRCFQCLDTEGNVMEVASY